MPYHPITKERISEKQAIKLRKEREDKIKRVLAKSQDCNALAKFLANEELLIIEDELRTLGGLESKDTRYNRPTQPPLLAKQRIRYDMLAGWTFIVSFIVLFWWTVIWWLR